MILIVALAVLSWEKPAGPRIIRKLWSNLREQGNEENLKENIPFPREIEGQQRATAQRMFPESDVDNSTIAPQDYDVRQSGRVLELHNRNHWIRPTDLSWLFFIFVTLREEPFKELSCKVIREVEDQGGQDRGGQEAEDSEK